MKNIKDVKDCMCVPKRGNLCMYHADIKRKKNKPTKDAKIKQILGMQLILILGNQGSQLNTFDEPYQTGYSKNIKNLPVLINLT